MKSMRIAILYICTGQYNIFWKDFFETCEKYFLTHCQKEYFVFTDADFLEGEKECPYIHRIFQKNLGWPDNTLKRYHIFEKIEPELRRFDYCFFMNANCVFNCEITEEEFLPQDKSLLVVQHPAFWNKKNTEFTYERNKHSSAYIPRREGKYYVCGGVNGGKTEAYLTLMRRIREQVDVDEEKHLVAVWHDESHLNKYIYEYDDCMVLPPGYCYPEGWNLPFENKIMVREKSKWVNVDQVKNITLWNKLKNKVKHIFRKMKRKLKL